MTLTSSRLLRFLASLVIRLGHIRLSASRVGFSLCSSLWRTILAFILRRGQSQVQLFANDVPVPAGERTAVGSLQASEQALKVEDEHRGTLATMPVLGSSAGWEDELSRHQVLISSHQFERFNLIPATPEGGSQRYKPRRVGLSQATDFQLDIPPGQQKLLSAIPLLPDGWGRYVHPEGVTLFYHEGLRVFTECDITDDRKRGEILFCAAKLVEIAIATNGVVLDELTEVVLNVDRDNDRCWLYYFVDHTHRLLFWVHTVNPHNLQIDLQGTSEYSHIRYMVESHYWYASIAGLRESRSHCEYYPHRRTLPKAAFEELRGMLNYAKTDMMTTDSSSSPFGQDELVAMLDLVNSLKSDEKISDPYSIWAIARLMAYFTENQFLNFCGQPCARLNADTTLLDQPNWNRHILFRAINLFLFGSPNEHALRLQRVWVDGMIIQPRWKDFINRLTSELSRYTIFSTVMLAVDFSFLAVPGVINTAPGSRAGPIQIIIYCSVVSTVASIVFSFGLLNVYTNPGLLVARNAVEAMWTLSQSKTGMAGLAITHSLPIASLIWSIVFFSAALAVQIFRPKELPTVVALSVEYLIIVLFVLIGVKVMRLFFKNDNEGDADIPATEEDLLSSGLQPKV